MNATRDKFDMTQFLARFTSLGRTVDPAYPGNRYIVLISVAAALIGAGVGLLNGENALARAVIAAGGAFIAWVIGREVDPDHDASALLGGLLGLGAGLFVDSFSLLALAGVMVAPRIVNRTVGPPLKRTDTLAVLVLTGLIALLTPYWMLALVITAAFVLDAWLDSPLYRGNGLHYTAALVAANFVVIAAIVNGLPGPVGSEVLPFAIVAVVTGIFTWTIVKTRDVTSVADVTGDPLNVWRVQGGMVIALLAGILMLWYGTAGIVAMFPLWAALAGASIYRIARAGQGG